MPILSWSTSTNIKITNGTDVQDRITYHRIGERIYRLPAEKLAEHRRNSYVAACGAPNLRVFPDHHIMTTHLTLNTLQKLYKEARALLS